MCSSWALVRRFSRTAVEWNVDEIIRFLGSLENVAELEFELRKRTFSSSWGNDSHTPLFQLSNLEFLTLTFGLDGINSTKNFFKYFGCQDVLELTIDAMIPRKSTPGRHVCSLLDCCKHVPSLVGLAITVHHEPDLGEGDYDEKLTEMIGQGTL